MKTPKANNRIRIPLNTVIGDRWLCAWQVVPGITWVQTRKPKFAEKLRKRSDSRRVAIGVSGGYLRTYEFKHSMRWAAGLIRRYTLALTVTNALKNELPARLAFVS